MGLRFWSLFFIYHLPTVILQRAVISKFFLLISCFCLKLHFRMEVNNEKNLLLKCLSLIILVRSYFLTWYSVPYCEARVLKSLADLVSCCDTLPHLRRSSRVDVARDAAMAGGGAVRRDRQACSSWAWHMKVSARSLTYSWQKFMGWFGELAA